MTLTWVIEALGAANAMLVLQKSTFLLLFLFPVLYPSLIVQSFLLCAPSPCSFVCSQDGSFEPNRR
jgi:hypothetical protein